MKTTEYLRPPLRFLSVVDILDQSPRAKRGRRLDRLAAFAESLGYISRAFPTRKLKQAALTLIEDKRPYCLRREGNLWFVNDRGYCRMESIGLTEDEVEALGIRKWNRRQVHGDVWFHDDLPLVSDRLRADWFAGAANLINDIVHLLRIKNQAKGNKP